MRLHDTIQGLAETFTQAVLAAIQALSLEEILALKGLVVGGAPRPSGAPPKTPRPPGRPGRLPRRSPEDVDRQAYRIVDYVKAHGPVRSEAMRADLGIDKREWLRPLQRALELGVKKQGNKRATEYSFGAKSAKPAKATPATKKRPGCGRAGGGGRARRAEKEIEERRPRMWRFASNAVTYPESK